MTAAIDRLFKLMCEQKASDLHLCVGMPPLVRKDGSIQLLELAAPALDAATMTGVVASPMPTITAYAPAVRHATAVPKSAVMKAVVTAKTLTDCIARMPSAGGNAPRPRMTNVENVKNTPPLTPHATARAPSTIADIS